MHHLDSAMKQLCQRRETAFKHKDQRAVDEIDDAIHATAAAQKGVRKAANVAEDLKPVRGRPEQQPRPMRPEGPPRAPTPPSALSGERYDESPSPPPPPRQRPTPGVAYVSAPSNYRGSTHGYSGSTSAQQPRRNSQHYENIRPPADNYRGSNGYRYRRRALDSSSSPTLDHAISNRSETGAVNLKGRDLLLD
ncbi:hypothetical protein H0H93_012845 [Arthromyces matolae]|nr:hypothetical protein H0H93_012845 [Arthromyces matolae]